MGYVPPAPPRAFHFVDLTLPRGGSITCRSCGAPIAPNEDACSYCTTVAHVPRSHTRVACSSQCARCRVSIHCPVRKP